MANDPSDPVAPKITMGAPEAGQKVRVGPDAAKTMAAIADVKRQVSDMVVGKRDPEQVRRSLIRRYYKGLMQAANPGASSVRGHRWAKVACHVGGTDIVIDWEYMPGPGGRPMVLAFCPKCYWLAPTQVRTADATKPVFYEEQLARVPGNPESDKKFVPFQIQATSPNEIYFDDNDRLCIDRLITCPQAARICGWTIKISHGVASEQPKRGRILRPNEPKAPTGPLIVKANS